MLVNKTLELKICDLGFARTTATIGPNDVGLSREAVTQYWRAPEVELSVGGYTKAIGTSVGGRRVVGMSGAGLAKAAPLFCFPVLFVQQTCGRWA